MRRPHVLILSTVHNVTEGTVRDFKIVSRNNTHTTFSFEMEYGLHDISQINYIYLYYKDVTHTYSGYRSNIYIYNRDLSVNGRVYTMTIPFPDNPKYIIWIEVYRRSGPRNLYSNEIYAHEGECMNNILECNYNNYAIFSPETL